MAVPNQGVLSQKQRQVEINTRLFEKDKKMSLFVDCPGQLFSTCDLGLTITSGSVRFSRTNWRRLTCSRVTQKQPPKALIGISLQSYHSVFSPIAVFNFVKNPSCLDSRIDFTQAATSDSADLHHKDEHFKFLKMDDVLPNISEYESEN